jgi:type IV pilus assembly protein PilM
MAFSILPKRFLGIDVGSSAIKIVELSSFAGRIKLSNFGDLPAKSVFKEPFRTFKKNALYLSVDDIAKAIKAILKEAKINTRKAFFSIPDFATFFTTFDLPPMTPQELPSAVKIEARKHIPVPLSEVIFDWRVLDKKHLKKDKKLTILLAAVPHEVINQYQKIAQRSELRLISLEAEIFSLVRVFGEEDKIISIVDIGARTTTCNIIENKILKRSFSLDIGGDLLSERIGKSLEIGSEEGEKLKKEFGIQQEGEKVREILIPLINTIIFEITKIFQNYELKEGKKIQKVIFTGGEANLPGLLEYSKIQLEREVEIGDPFRRILYPAVLDEILKEIGPAFSIAVGLALKGFEK